MVGSIKTVYLGTTEKTSEKGNVYRVASFLDEGTPVTCMIASECSDALPNALDECILLIEVNLKYRNCKVIEIEILKE